MKRRTGITACATAILLTTLPALAQTRSGSSRVSFFGSSQRATYSDGTSRAFSEFTAAVTLRSELLDGRDGVEYGCDVRNTAYPSSEGRASRQRIYDAWAGTRLAGGRLSLRAGQMWLYDLGALGSVGGAMLEYRGARSSPNATRVRAGIFAGVEPKSFEAGYLTEVKKQGAWIAIDGGASRRHVLGYVRTQNTKLTERSVVSTTNFIPGGTKFFLYQAAEYDLTGPGGIGKGGLNYLFANLRYAPVRALDLMGTYHHGRSIDARTITDDILNGRPVDQKSLDGFLFESVGGRVTVEVFPNVRVNAGYSADRHNRGQPRSNRVSAGLWAANLAHTGIDFSLSDNRNSGGGSSYDAWYASLGRTFLRKIYISADYGTSLAVITVSDGGTIIEQRPRSRRFGLNSVWNMNRTISILLNAERFLDEATTDDRAGFGLIIRF